MSRSHGGPRETAEENQRPSLQYLDVYLLFVAAPIALLIGAPAAGYAIGAAAWVILRALGVAVDRRAAAMTHVVDQAALRISYRLVRVAAVTGASLVALGVDGKAGGLAALLVVAFAFTVRLAIAVRDTLRSLPSRGSHPEPSP